MHAMRCVQPDGKWNENDEVCKVAAMHGDAALLEWMHRNGCLFDEQLCTESARGNKVRICTLYVTTMRYLVTGLITRHVHSTVKRNVPYISKHSVTNSRYLSTATTAASS
jgi:hypothetical protein